MFGRVHHWDRQRRYGKVTGTDQRDYFVFWRALVGVAELQTGQIVEFTPAEAPRGPHGICVRPLEPAPAEE